MRPSFARLSSCAAFVFAAWAAAPAHAQSTSAPAAGLTFGGEIRLKYERYAAKNWDPRQAGDGYLLERTLLHTDYRAARLHLYAQLERSAVAGGGGLNDPTWRDALALPDLFVEYTIGPTRGAGGVTVRAGRQELAYGAGRMIDNRYGLNTLQAFDGVLLRARRGAWQTDVFWTRPVAVVPQAFDDLADRTRSLLGAYASRALGHDTWQVYGLEDQRGSQFAYRGSRPETRFTLGTRYAAARGRLRSDTEADVQFGSFGTATIAAAALESSTSWEWAANRNAWLAGFGAGFATGDHDPRGGRFTAFRAPYPTGLTFGIVQANGVTNVSGFSLTQQYTYARKLTLTAKEYFSYRQSLADGLYAPAGFGLRAPAGSSAAPVGQLAYLTASEALSPRASLNAAYARYDIGQFLRQSGPAAGVASASTAYGTLWAQYRF